MVRKVYIRQLRLDEARKKFHREIENAFMKGETIIEVIHGIGTYRLRKMLEEEIETIDYIRHFDSGLHDNPGSIKLEILGPEASLLKKYL